MSGKGKGRGRKPAAAKTASVEPAVETDPLEIPESAKPASPAKGTKRKAGKQADTIEIVASPPKKAKAAESPKIASPKAASPKAKSPKGKAAAKKKGGAAATNGTKRGRPGKAAVDNDEPEVIPAKKGRAPRKVEEEPEPAKPVAKAKKAAAPKASPKKAAPSSPKKGASPKKAASKRSPKKAGAKKGKAATVKRLNINIANILKEKPSKAKKPIEEVTEKVVKTEVSEPDAVVEDAPKAAKSKKPSKTTSKRSAKDAASDAPDAPEPEEAEPSTSKVKRPAKTESKEPKPTTVGRKRKPVTVEVEENEADEVAEEPVDKKKSRKAPSKATAPKLNSVWTDYSTFSMETPANVNLKIATWNVSGIRAWLGKGGLEYVDREKPDILCLQETKCTEDALPPEAKIKGYHCYWLAKPGGQAGVAIYSKLMPYTIKRGLGDEEQDDDGRLMMAEYEKYYLVCVYVPNSGRKLVTLPKRLRWDVKFQKYIKDLDAKKPVIVCGDMNVSHLEIDLTNPKPNKRNAGFTQEERDGMTEFLSMGFVDTFRHLYPDLEQAYTFWTYMMNCRAKNVGWRLDYFIVSERFLKHVVDNVMRSKVLGSDHCPVVLLLNL